MLLNSGVSWEGNYNFYNNLMPDVTWPALPISYIDVIASKMNCQKDEKLAFHSVLKK